MTAWNLIRIFLKYFFVAFGIPFSFALVLSFTSIPFWAYHALGTKNAASINNPNYIIQMSGSGMPSPDGLIRTYYTAAMAQKFPDAKIIIALPDKFTDSVQLTVFLKEYSIRGIDTNRLIFEPLGINTFTQAKKIKNLLSTEIGKTNLLIVTSPEHMYRTVKTFKKLGMQNVGGKAAFEHNLQDKNLLDPDETNITQNLDLRYNFWNYLKLEITVAREYCAIVYYKLKGWI